MQKIFSNSIVFFALTFIGCSFSPIDKYEGDNYTSYKRGNFKVYLFKNAAHKQYREIEYLFSRNIFSVEELFNYFNRQYEKDTINVSRNDLGDDCLIYEKSSILIEYVDIGEMRKIDSGKYYLVEYLVSICYPCVCPGPVHILDVTVKVPRNADTWSRIW